MTSSPKLDNEQVHGLALNQAVEKIRGPVNTNITLFCVRVRSPASTGSSSKRGPHSQAHLTMTPVASVYPDSRVASLRKHLDGRNVHFFAALADRAFSAAGHQQALKLRH